MIINYLWTRDFVNTNKSGIISIEKNTPKTINEINPKIYVIKPFVNIISVSV